MSHMYISRVNYSSEGMKFFHALAKKYYDIDDGAGYFLEAGANIGTTGIYFLKKFAPNLKWIAFEPDAENFKLLQVNTILNDLQDSATLVNCGLGDNSGEMTMYRNLENPGGNSIFQYSENMPSETIKIITLDDRLAENKIAPSEIKYIWIDTEGYEAQVLLGAKNLLSQNPAPIFMECNLNLWNDSGRFEDLMTLLEKYYSHFVLFKSGKELKMYPLETLRTFDPQLGQIGDIFLIKAGIVL